MNALKMCLNWKVIAGVAVVAVGFYTFAPGLAAAALPFLVLAICPLSMLLMMGMMNKGESGAACAVGRMNAESASASSAEELARLKAQQQELARQIEALESDAAPTSDLRRADASAAG